MRRAFTPSSAMSSWTANCSSPCEPLSCKLQDGNTTTTTTARTVHWGTRPRANSPLVVGPPLRSGFRLRLHPLLRSSPPTSTWAPPKPTNPNSHNPWYRKWGQVKSFRSFDNRSRPISEYENHFSADERRPGICLAELLRNICTARLSRTYFTRSNLEIISSLIPDVSTGIASAK